MSGRSNLNPNQLSMFMTGSEIQSNYVPWEGDREEPGDYLEYQGRGYGTITAQGVAYQRQDERFDEGVETDDALWDRKYEEAGDYGLTDSLHTEGVRDPVHLGVQRSFERGDKPSIFGGHHRIAVMGRDRPDELMPVLHYDTFSDARILGDRPGAPYRYT